jgi:hypothetical protein
MSRVLELHTSDRILFKRCRRRWNWASPLRQHLRPIGDPVDALWFGTGIHFALEDFHGAKRFTTAAEAFDAFVDAHKPHERPDSWQELSDMGAAMLDYYENIWEPKFFSEYRTATWHDVAKARLLETGESDLPDTQEPMVELRVKLPLYRELDGTEIHYDARIDRVVIDAEGRFWVVDYKTAQRFDTSKLETDPQASAYTWAIQKFLGITFEGVIWVQLLKDTPKGPKQLVNGEFSQNRNMRTSHALYRQALIDAYGKVPSQYIDFLNYLVTQETENGDKYIRFDRMRRNQHFVYAEEVKIFEELMDMVNPDLPLYPNPTRDCAWDCPFRSPCLAMDDGSDWQWLIENNYGPAVESEPWKDRIKVPMETT